MSNSFINFPAKDPSNIRWSTIKMTIFWEMCGGLTYSITLDGELYVSNCVLDHEKNERWDNYVLYDILTTTLLIALKTKQQKLIWDPNNKNTIDMFFIKCVRKYLPQFHPRYSSHLTSEEIQAILLPLILQRPLRVKQFREHYPEYIHSTNKELIVDRKKYTS